MGRLVWGQNNFSSGQIGQSLMAGTDLKEYANGAEFIKNFVPGKSRGLNRRTGTRFLADITAWGESRLLTFSTIEGDFILAIRDTGAGAVDPFQFYTTAGAAITTTNSFNSVANLAKEEWTFVQIGGQVIFCHLSGLIPPCISAALGSFASLIVVATMFQGFGTGYFVGSPALNDCLKMPYRVPNISTKTMTPSATTAIGTTINVTSSVSFFDAGHIGSFMKITQGATTGVVRFTALTSALIMVGTVVIVFGSTAASTNWEEGAWSDYRGWPGLVTSFNERLVYASNLSEYDTVWNSEAGNLWLMMQHKLAQDATTDVSTLGYYGPVVDSDAFHYIVNSQDQNFIQWITSGRSLQIGTENSEFISKGSNGKYGVGTGEVFEQTANGGSPARPAKKGESTYYVTADGKSIMQFLYQESNGSFISKDITVLAEDIVYHNIDEATENYSKTAFIELVKNKSLDVIYCLTNNEELVGVTLKESSDLIAWHTYDFGCDAVHGVSSLATESNAYHNTYVCVERTINSVTKYYIEYMSQPYLRSDLDSASADADEYPWYVDSAKKVTGTAITTITGLSHLEAEVVRVLGDGADHGTFTVASGQIELTTAVDVAIVGKAYTSYLRTLSPTVGSIFGDSTPFIKSINKTVLRVYKSLGGLFRSSDLDLESDLEYIEVEGTELYTGDVELNLGATPNIRQFIEVETSDPFPLNILGIFFRGEVEDGR